MACELRKFGAAVEEGPDFLRVTPIAPGQWRAASIHTYDDHRMAMCASLAAFNPAGLPVRIEDPRCVAKTFPDYFETLFAIAQAAAPVPVICVDGPTASGKGTLASRVAQQLGWRYLDSGALYRVLGLAARRQGVELAPAHEGALADLARSLPVRFEADRVWLDEQDVSDAIRTEQAGMDASRVSALPAVRTALVPTVDQTRVVGLIALPGTMTGLIIAGVDPLQAIRYQIIVMYMLLAAWAVSALVTGRVAQGAMFDDAQRLVAVPA